MIDTPSQSISLYNIYENIIKKQNITPLKESFVFYISFLITIILVFTLFRFLNTYIVLFLFLSFLIFHILFKKKTIKETVEIIFPYKKLLKLFSKKDKNIENFYLNSKIKDFLDDLEKLNRYFKETAKIKNEISGLKKVLDLSNKNADNKIQNKELEEQIKLLEKTLEEYETEKVNLKYYIIEKYGNKIFILNFRKINEFKNLDEYDKSIIEDNIYILFEFYAKYLKDLLKKFYITKKEKINSKLEVIIIQY